MQQQDALCSSLCGSGTSYISGTGLAECSQCGNTNVNINLPGSQGQYYYPGYYSYAAADSTPCYESSYDPFDWYDYYFKYDSALAPYYEPWTPPQSAEEEAAEEEPAQEPAEEEEPVEQEEPAEEEAPVEEEDQETSAVEEPQEEEEEEEASTYTWPRPSAQPAGVSTAGSFTMSGKTMPPRANTNPSGFNVRSIGGHRFDATGEPINGEMVFFDTSDVTMQPHPPLWK